MWTAGQRLYKHYFLRARLWQVMIYNLLYIHCTATSNSHKSIVRGPASCVRRFQRLSLVLVFWRNQISSNIIKDLWTSDCFCKASLPNSESWDILAFNSASPSCGASSAFLFCFFWGLAVPRRIRRHCLPFSLSVVPWRDLPSLRNILFFLLSELSNNIQLLYFEWSPPWHFKTACWHNFCLKLLSRHFGPTNYPNHLFHLAGHCACQSVKQDINMSVGHVK